jgi:glycerophosphoryl diester phosphodiesterase
LSFLTGLLAGCENRKANVSEKVTERNEIQQLFRYTPDASLLISGHRGSKGAGLSENCLETFQHVAAGKMPVFFEIDPRLTKDNVIVLMHDVTIDRTTIGSGKLSDYTWKELQAFQLKDSDGTLTPYKIPTLEEVIRWSRGKSLVNLDKKDVPMEMITTLIRKCGAEDFIMLTVHTGAQARYYYDRFPRIMLLAFMRNEKEYEDMAISGVPWENMIAYIGATIDGKNKEIVERLHRVHVRCMISVAPTHDKLATKAERSEGYKKEMEKKPDIIESDYPLDVWEILKP